MVIAAAEQLLTMTTFLLTAGVPPRDRLEQIGLWSLIGIVAAMQLSIAAAQILLAVASLAWLVSHISRSERLQAPRSSGRSSFTRR